MNALTPTAQLALDTIHQKPVSGIPSWLINPMEHRIIDRLAGVPEGTYRRKPIETYRAMQIQSGTCLMDQWIPKNPLPMTDAGFESGTKKKATTGAEHIERDGIVIDSPEAVVYHMEKFTFPQLRQAAVEFDEDREVQKILAEERRVQTEIGPTMLKGPYGFIRFPGFAYGFYGYAHYFGAYALYPEVMETFFALQADVALRNNRAAARAFAEGDLPQLYRLDHDMAGSQGMLVNIKSLDKIWFPHFGRCLEPMLKTEVKMIWHCDGNLMEMVPRLLEVGLRGFQGFQYEDGMDYEKICRMKDREGRDLVIIAGVSVTRTLPHGKPADVKREMEWLVKNGLRTGLFLGGSSSIAPGVSWENIKTLVEGFRFYREHGR